MSQFAVANRLACRNDFCFGCREQPGVDHFAHGSTRAFVEVVDFD